MATDEREVSAAGRVALALLTWSLFALVMGVVYVIDDRPAAWAAIGIGAVTLAIAWSAKKRGQWWQPLIAAHYVLAFGCVIAGPLANRDEYVVGGVICLTLLGIALCFLGRMGEVGGAAAETD